MNAVQFPKYKTEILDKKRYLSIHEIKMILEHAKNHQEVYIFIFAIFTGLRQGEILALKYKDLKDGQILVNKTMYILTHLGKQRIICSSAKTSKSVRSVPLL